MFHFWKKAEVDKSKVTKFVDWFFENEASIRSSVDNRETDRDTMMKMLDEVEAQLAKVYRDGYRGRIEFDYGGKEKDWELNLYHLNKKYLIEATKMIAEELQVGLLISGKLMSANKSRSKSPDGSRGLARVINESSLMIMRAKRIFLYISSEFHRFHLWSDYRSAV